MDAIDKLITSGDAYWDDNGTLVGVAADGVHVRLGFFTRDATLDYLAQYPTPDTW